MTHAHTLTHAHAHTHNKNQQQQQQIGLPAAEHNFRVAVINAVRKRAARRVTVVDILVVPLNEAPLEACVARNSMIMITIIAMKVFFFFFFFNSDDDDEKKKKK